MLPLHYRANKTANGKPFLHAQALHRFSKERRTIGRRRLEVNNGIGDLDRWISGSMEPGRKPNPCSALPNDPFIRQSSDAMHNVLPARPIPFRFRQVQSAGYSTWQPVFATFQGTAAPMNHQPAKQCLPKKEWNPKCSWCVLRSIPYSPTTVTTIRRVRGLMSASRWNSCCQVPSINRPSASGRVISGPIIVACRCEWPLPSCHACSWP